jgi:hypothetical protein
MQNGCLALLAYGYHFLILIRGYSEISLMEVVGRSWQEEGLHRGKSN